MDKENKINTFEEVGLINPYAKNPKKSMKSCVKQMASWEFMYGDVYKAELLRDLIDRVREGEAKVCPPRC
jgi:hypothetical protein